VTPGGPGSTAGIVLTNHGAAALTVTQVGPVSAPFRVDKGSCGDTPFILVSGASCELVTGFQPTGAGHFDTRLVLSVVHRTPVEIGLSGHSPAPGTP